MAEELPPDQQPTTPEQPGDISTFLLDELNPSVIKDFTTTLRPYMIIDNPLAVYTKLIGMTHQPNRFAGQLQFKAIVLMRIDSSTSETPFASFMKKFISSPFFRGNGYNDKVPAFICMVPELFSAMPNPFRFGIGTGDYIKRSLRFPLFTTDSAHPRLISELDEADIGSVVNVRFDNLNYTGGTVTDLVIGGKMGDAFHNTNLLGAYGSMLAGNAINQEGTKLSQVATRTGYTTDQIIQLYREIVAGGNITSDYGKRVMNGEERMHEGIDIGAVQGTEVFAAHDGYVEVAGGSNSSRSGIMVRLRDDAGTTVTRYMHLSAVTVSKDDFVLKGQTVGLVGNTGVGSTGPHLHFEVDQPSGNDIDPWPYLASTISGFPSPIPPESDADDIADLEYYNNQVTDTTVEDAFLSMSGPSSPSE